MKRLFFVYLCVVLTGCASQTLEFSGTIESEQVDVYAEIPGKFLELSCDEGGVVKKGDVLARIDRYEIELELERANYALLAAEKTYENVSQGTRYEQIDQAEAQVEVQKAILEELQSGSRPEQIAQAQAAVDAARARLDAVNSGNRSELIAQGEASVQAAKARLDSINIGNRDESIAQAAATVSQAESALALAQQNHDYRVENLEKLRSLEQAGGATHQQVVDSENLVDNARTQVASAEQQLAIAKSALELLKNGATEQAKQEAQAQYDQALANLELLKNGSTQEAKREAQAQYEQAVAALELLQQGATSQSIDVAKASLEQANANLAMLKNGPRNAEIEIARANMEQARTSVEIARYRLERTDVTAPIDGRILYKTVDVGEYATPGGMVCTIQEMDEFYIRIYVPQRHSHLFDVGTKVEVVTTASVDGKLGGEVFFKSPRAEFTPRNTETTESKEENTVVAVKVRLEGELSNISAGMTASVRLP